MDGSDGEYYKDILDMVPCGICQVALNEELTILYANQFYYDIYGYTPESAEEKGFTSAKYILPESDYPSILKEVFRHIRQKDRYFQLEYRGVHSSGKLLWLLVRCIYDPAGPESMLCALVDIADQKEMEEELRMTMEESRIAFRLTDKLMYIFDVANRRLYQPESVADEFGLPAVVDHVPYSVVDAGAIDEASREDYIGFYESIINGKPWGQAIVKKRRKNGSFGWYEAKFSVVYDQGGKPGRAVISCENITEQRERELAYQKWSQFFRAQEGKTIGYYEYDLTRNTVEEGEGGGAPDYLRSFRRYTQVVRYIGETFVCEEDQERFYNFFNRDKLLARYYGGQRSGSFEYLRKRADGSLYWARATIQLIADPYNDDVRLFMMTLDIDREKRENLKMRSQIEHDGMTGSLNRETFIARVTEVLGQSDYSMHHALIMLDIDQFKKHNDNYGHQFGDQVIRETARLLMGFLRKSDLCGRLGGDEFMVFLNNITSESDVLPRIDKLCSLLRREYPERDEVTCSMGVVFYPHDGEDFQMLYHNVDLALYEAKRAGRANFRLYRRDMEGTAMDNLRKQMEDKDGV